MKKRNIHFILTGGTINSFYDPATESSVPSKESIIPYYIRDVIKPHFKASFEETVKVDSRYMKDSHRKKIMAAAERASAKEIVIVHGTSTMAETALFLEKNLKKNSNKKIVLTGAMIPLKDFVQSDGGFNLGYALATLEHMEPGIRLCMNSTAFRPGETVKNIPQARFEGGKKPARKTLRKTLKKKLKKSPRLHRLHK